MERHALIDKDNKVVNIIISPHDFKVPEGYKKIRCEDSSVKAGHRYHEANGSFSKE